MKKRGQVWGIDLIVGATIIMAGIFSFYLYYYNLSSKQETKLNDLSQAGDQIAEALLSSGNPQNWDTNNVIRIGLADNGKINSTKLDMWYELSESDYQYTLQLFKITSNYFVNFTEPFIYKGNYIQGIGKIPTEEASDVAKTSRFTVYNGKPTTMRILTWE